MIGKACKYDDKFMCFKWEACVYSSLNECLKVSVMAQSRQLEHIKHRQMQKHSEVSIKWRNSSFYYKKKCKQLEAFLLTNGLELPSSSVKENTNENLFRDNKEENGGEGLPLHRNEE